MYNNQSLSEEALPLIGLRNAFDRKYSSRYSLPNPNNEGTPLRRPLLTYKYPIAVIFILIAKFFEAFAANGIRTILALFLRDDLYFSENFSTIMLHVFNFFGQFCPIFGAIIADNYIGNIKTINYFCILYGIGWIGFITTSFPIIGLPIIFLVSISLLCIAIGNGSIRACITSLGAKQFILPEQEESLGNYFSHYYFFYYIGIFLSKILPPMLRAKTKCFDKELCYPVVFSLLGISFLVSWLIFSIGKFFYNIEYTLEENILLKFYDCIRYALVQKYKSHEKKPYWLYYSIEIYSKDFIRDVEIILKVTKLFLPLIVYYALLAQIDSTWTFQATQMNKTIFGTVIEADQAKAMGPVFLFTMIPIWQYIFVPLLAYFNIQIHPLNSVAVGGLCAALSFICSGLLELKIESSAPNSINIAWQIPQFLLIMMGELYISIPGLQFAFTQAPSTMKSVLTAAWFSINSFGNLLVIFITEINLVKPQSSEYFFYAILMFCSIIIFTIMACEFLAANPVTLKNEINKNDVLIELDNKNQRRHSYSYGSFIEKST